jgi:hypothetical protein
VEPIANGANAPLRDAAVPIAKTNRNVPISSTAYFRPASAAGVVTAGRSGTAVVVLFSVYVA